MILRIFSVRDAKADAFLQPMFMQSRGVALRAFSDSCMDSSHMFNRHPEDYCLYELGIWDDGKGSFELYQQPMPIANGYDFADGDLAPVVIDDAMVDAKAAIEKVMENGEATKTE